jgi:hypothetical protein
MKNRRRDQRWPSYLGASINLNRRMPIAACIVKNTSSSGARLALHNSILVPDEFDLVVPHKHAECRMRVRWRDHEFSGVEIMYLYPDDRPVSPEQVQCIRRLQEENAGLRRQVGLDPA